MTVPSLNGTKLMLLAGLLASSMLLSSALAQTTGQAALPTTTPVPETPATWHARHDTFFRRNWGVDIVGVRYVSSGMMLEFSYRVLDAKKAAALNDKKSTPYLIDEATGAELEVPQMEKVGQLRQTAPPESGRIYWMVFGNTGRAVKPGSRVSVVIGKFRADELVVQASAGPVPASVRR